MRVCLVSRELAPFFGSGVGVYAVEAARAWVSAGHEVHLITGDHAGVVEGGPALVPGVVFHTVDLQDGPASELPEPLGAVQWPLGAYDRLWRLHARIGFEYVEFPDFGGEGHFAVQGRRLLPGRPEGLPGCVIGVRLHMPAMLIDEMNRRTWRGRLRAYLSEMERGVIAGADVVWAPCRAVVEAVRAMGVAVEDSVRRPVIVSANPFEPGSMDADAERPTVDAGGDETVVFVGRLERRKGPDILVRAAVDLVRSRRALRVRLIGGDTDTGPLDSSVLEWVGSMIPADCRDRIVLEGHRTRRECVGAVRGATVVCFPAWWDNWPYAVLEAMAAGACVVASDSGGHAEMVQDGRTGLLVRTGDPGGLADGLRRALDDRGLRERLGAAAIESAGRMGDPARFARETMARVAELVSARRTAPGASVVREHTDDPAVSVVIPHKDMAEFLPDALASLDRQTLRGFEVILVDDGSEDPRAVEIIERLEREATGDAGAFRLRVVRRPGRSGGPAAARNAGIAAAGAPIVVTLDADDTLAPTHLEKCVAALSANPDLACVGALVSYFDESPERATGSWAPLGLVRDMLPAMNTMGTGSGIAIRRAVLAGLRPEAEGGGPFDPGVPGYEDWDLYCALAARGHRGAILPELLVNYRVREGSRYHARDRLRHDRLAAELAARHPGLAERPDAALRLVMAEGRARQAPLQRRLRRVRRERRALRRIVKRLEARLAASSARAEAFRARLERARRGAGSSDRRDAVTSALPLRYRAADRAAGLLRRAGLSGAARRVLTRLGRRC